MKHRSKSRKRPAFTLVELLMVLAIILVLVSLLTAAVVRVTRMGKRTSNMHDIEQLNNAVVNFMQAFNVNYLPSRLELEETPSNYYTQVGTNYVFKDQVAQDSVVYLKRLFPKIDLSVTGQAIDWNGDGTAGNASYTLQGDQCLVFFLGGIPASAALTGAPGVTGFSTNPLNPAYQVGQNGATVKGPFFEFKADRLVDLSGGQGFYSYLDAYGKQPFAYFSNYGKRNLYNNYYAYKNAAGTIIAGGSDCSNLSVWPYAEAWQSATNPTYPYMRYQKPDAFQIISAGEDLTFGPGSLQDPSNPSSGSVLWWNAANGFLWSPATVANTTPPTTVPPAGNDDQTNFSGILLGDAGS